MARRRLSELSPRSKVYPVTAIFQIGMAEFDNLFVYMALPEAQAFLQQGQSGKRHRNFSSTSPRRLDAVRSKIDRAVMRPMIMTDWRERNKTFFDALNVERNVMFIILTLIVLVAALNIVSGLIMLVKDKGRDIAILRTMGATQGGVMRIFLITGASIGIAGTLAGCLLGLRRREQCRGACASFSNGFSMPICFRPRSIFFRVCPPWSMRAMSPLSWLHDARALAAGDALSVMARGKARSRRSAALRIAMSASGALSR